MKYFPITCLMVAMATSAVHADDVISDSFETRDMSADGSIDLDWGSTNRTTLVKRDPVLGDLIIYDDAVVEIQQGFDRQWQAKDGDVSLRFDYPSGTNSWAEQRFALSSAREEIWIRFWLKVPINYKHSSNSPSNSKLFALWMDDYSSKGAGPTVIWEFWNDGAGGSKVAYHYSPGGYRTANSHKQHTSFIRYPDDQGRWMQVVMHIKAASHVDANDGVIRLYRRWADESSFAKLHEDTKADIAPPSSGPEGWKAGYLMGWSNPGYDQQTEWLLDDFKMSSTSLLTVDDTTGSPSEPEPTPSPEPELEPELEPEPETPTEDDSCKPPRIPNILS
jgi:hypothetical protein